MSLTVFVYTTGAKPKFGAIRSLNRIHVVPHVITTELQASKRRKWEHLLERQHLETCVLHTSENSLAAIYNLALCACKTPYFALLSDDCLPTSAWWSELLRAWEDASSQTTVIGGGISIANVPSNLQSLYGGYSYGTEIKRLDADKQTLLGNNVSFRVCSAKAVQGFWPARGAHGGPNWFSEEHHLQRELSHLGWQLFYVPDLTITRHVDVSNQAFSRLIQARLYYGSRLATIGEGRLVKDSLKNSLKACAGVLTARLKQDRLATCARACRVSENIGALLGKHIAKRGLEATGRTPFRSSVPKYPQRSSLIKRVYLANISHSQPIRILLYHRVTELAEDPLRLSMSPSQFQEELTKIQYLFTPLALSEIFYRYQENTLPEDAIAITFDDGYIDNFENALPLLDKAQIPATFFISTAHVQEQKGFYWDDVTHIMLNEEQELPEELTLTIGSHRCCWPTRTRKQRVQVQKYLHAWLQPQSCQTIENTIKALYEWANLALRPYAKCSDRPMTVEELQLLANHPGIEIGAHSHYHISLANQSQAVQHEQIETSKSLLEDWLPNKHIQGFSYPYGVPNDNYTLTTASKVKQSGFDFAVSNSSDINLKDKDTGIRFQLPRTSSCAQAYEDLRKSD